MLHKTKTPFFNKTIKDCARNRSKCNLLFENIPNFLKKIYEKINKNRQNRTLSDGEVSKFNLHPSFKGALFEFCEKTTVNFFY